MSFDPERFANLMASSMSDAVVYADAEGRIRFRNKGAERIFGFATAEALGRSLDIIIPEPLRKRHWAGYEKTMRTGETRYAAGDLLAVPALRRDGVRLSVEFTILPFHDDTGTMVGIAAMMRDVTARAKAAWPGAAPLLAHLRPAIRGTARPPLACSAPSAPIPTCSISSSKSAGSGWERCPTRGISALGRRA